MCVCVYRGRPWVAFNARARGLARVAAPIIPAFARELLVSLSLSLSRATKREKKRLYLSLALLPCARALSLVTSCLGLQLFSRAYNPRRRRRCRWSAVVVVYSSMYFAQICGVIVLRRSELFLFSPCQGGRRAPCRWLFVRQVLYASL